MPRPHSTIDRPMKYDTHFKSLKDEVSPQEWQTRVELAACYRLVDIFGMTDLIYNHITARIPGTDDHLLINLYGLLYKEITASSLVKITLDGEELAKPDTDYGINKSGYVIHGAIHKARPEVKCVLHTHTRAGMAVVVVICGVVVVLAGGSDVAGATVSIGAVSTGCVETVSDLSPHEAASRVRAARNAKACASSASPIPCSARRASSPRWSSGAFWWAR